MNRTSGTVVGLGSLCCCLVLLQGCTNPKALPTPEAASLVDPLPCTKDLGDITPYAINLDDPSLISLEEAIGSDRIAVVSFSCSDFKVLPDCQVKGKYGFKGVSKKERLVSFVSNIDAQTNLPGGTTTLQAQFAQGNKLHLATSTIGKTTASRINISPEDLEGRCDGATHFVRSVYVGAWATRSSSDNSIKAAVDVFGYGAKAGASSSSDLQRTSGELVSCERATPDDPNPPAQCNALIQVQLLQLSMAPRNAAEADLPRCSGGQVYAAGKCQDKKAADQPYVCDPPRLKGSTPTLADVKECQEQCEKGEGRSCALASAYLYRSNVAELRPPGVKMSYRGCKLDDADSCAFVGGAKAAGPGWAGETSDPVESTRLYKKGCDLGGEFGCSYYAESLLKGYGIAKDAQKGVDLLNRTCESGLVFACTHLGSMYKNGLITGSSDLAQASRWWDIACTKDSPDGCEYLGLLYQNGQHFPEDKARARALFQKSCDLGRTVSCGHLK